MLFIPILASLGVLRLGLSILTSEDKAGHPRTYKKLASALSLTLASIGTLLLSATYDDEDLQHLIDVIATEGRALFLVLFPALQLQFTRAARAARLDEFINYLVALRPLAPGVSRTLAFVFFFKAILMGSDAFRRCDRLENMGPASYDLMVTIRAVDGAGKYVKDHNGEVREATVIASDSDTTVAEISPDLLPPPSKALVTQAKALSRPNDTAIESTIVIQLKSDSSAALNPALLSALDAVVTETLTALIPATLRVMAPTQASSRHEKLNEKALDKVMKGSPAGRRGFAYIDDSDV